MEKITRFRDVPKFTRDGNWQADFDIFGAIRFIDENITECDLQLNPDFQRGHVWTAEQQIKWLEFFFKGGKTGRVVYFNKPDWNSSVPEGAYNDFVCVDGLQRITAIRRFINNEIPVFGSYLCEFEDRPSMARDTIKININDLKTKKEVLQWYVDMNAGGTPHSDEEIERVKDMIETLNEEEYQNNTMSR